MRIHCCIHNHRLGTIVPVRATASLILWSFSCDKLTTGGTQQLRTLLLVACQVSVQYIIPRYHSKLNTCTSKHTFVIHNTNVCLLYTTYMHILLTDNMEGVKIYHPHGDGQYQHTAHRDHSPDKLHSSLSS